MVALFLSFIGPIRMELSATKLSLAELCSPTWTSRDWVRQSTAPCKRLAKYQDQLEAPNQSVGSQRHLQLSHSVWPLRLRCCLLECSCFWCCFVFVARSLLCRTVKLRLGPNCSKLAGCTANPLTGCIWPHLAKGSALRTWRARY